MIFGLLKRKFFATEERDEDATTPPSNANSEACSPRKRLRVAGPTSINEATQNNSQTACAAGRVKETDKDLRKEKVKRKRELRAKLREVEETTARIKKEAERDVAIIRKLTEDTMTCMVCQDMIQNPQSLQCGHSACYACLRSWWTQPLPHTDDLELIDTVAESDLDDDVVEPNAAAEPRVRRRHVFRSAVKRKKTCPYCNTRVTSRPVPDLRTRDIVDTLNSDLAPIPANIQARREAHLTRRRDIWHGIFEPVAEPMVIPGPATPPPPHSDPILNHIAQAQFRQVAEEAVARQTREREQWFQDGRRLGFLRTMQQLAREEQAQPAAVARPGQGQVFGRGHPLPPLPGPGVGGQGAALMVVLHGPPAAPADEQPI